jgi:dihydrofolate reductase
MKHLTSIVAMDRNGAIGVDNQLPWRLRSDLRFFRETTSGHVVIMGRVTYESLGCKPLPNRYNIVLSRSSQLLIDSAAGRAVHSVPEALQVAAAVSKNKECFVIGGKSIYEQFAEYVDIYLVTLVDKVAEDADTHLDPESLFQNDNWQESASRLYIADGNHDEVDFTIRKLHSRSLASVCKNRNDTIAGYLAHARTQVPRQTFGRPRKTGQKLNNIVSSLI